MTIRIPGILTAAIGAIFALSAYAETGSGQDETTQAAHPFFREELYPRWSEMTPQQLTADMLEATLRMHNRHAELLEISPANATFDNTFAHLSMSTAEADQLEMYVKHLYWTDCIFNEQADTFQQGVKLLRRERNKLFYTSSIQDTLKAWAKSPQAAALSPARQYFVKRQTDIFYPQPDADTAKKLELLQAELSALEKEYVFNIAYVENTWHYLFTERGQLKGTPPDTVAAMEAAARRRGFGTAEKPAWLYTLQLRSTADIRKYCVVEATRKKCWQGYNSPGNTRSHDNGSVVLRIMQLRQDIAALRGYKNHADSLSRDALMNSGQKALNFIDELLEKIKPQVQALHAATLQAASQQCGRKITHINPWDYSFYSAAATETLNKFSLRELRPYLEYENTLQATFKHFGALYGLKIQEVPAAYVIGGNPCPPDHAEVWHPDVRIFAVHDAASGQHLGSFYLDAYTRDGRKYGNSSQIISYGTPDSKNKSGFPPLAVLILELHKPAPGNTQLLSHLELRMLFHELGHIFHLLLGKGEFKDQSAAFIARDFIELPAQLQERRAWEPDVLCDIGRHYRTGEPMPRELAIKASAARTDSDYPEQLHQQLLLAKLDLEMHTHYYDKFHGKNPDLATQELLADYEIPMTVVPPTVMRRFLHCVEGYDARYYAYVLAEVLAADLHEEFIRNGVNNSALGKNYRKAILEPGNSRPAIELYRNFMGRDVSADAFLRHLTQ